MKLTSHRHTIVASCAGYAVQAVVNIYAPLLFLTFRSEFGIPLEKITFLITLNFITQLTVDLLSAKVVDRLGYRVCAVLAHALAVLGLAALAILPDLLPDPFTGLLIATFLCACGSGVIEVLITPVVESCPTKNKAAVMSLAHAAYCGGSVLVIVLSTLFFNAFGTGAWRTLTLLWAVLPFLNLIYFLFVPLYPLVKEGKGMALSALLKTPVFWLFFLFMLCAGASELAMSQWVSAFAESALGVSKTLGDLFGAALFAVFMGSARLYYAFGKHDLQRSLIVSASLCILSYGLAAFSPWPALSLAGCALCGFSVGAMWPGTLSLASRRLPRGGNAMFALLAMAGDVGCTSGPTLVGLVAPFFANGLKASLAAAMAFPAILLTALLLGRKALSEA